MQAEVAEREEATGEARQVEQIDTLIIGAGISGIGAACHLTRECPGREFAILEGRDAIGGTWDLFRYPGIRSDSDMFTFGYRFRPWTEGKDIADAPSILNYLRETMQEYDIEQKIRFGHRVQRLEWRSDLSQWLIDVLKSDGTRARIACNFLMTCTGYYDYAEGYRPEFPGEQDFNGQIVHPQHWPENLDYRGKRVVVIGSGATAVTLVPAMASDASHVTMLQRSPTYVFTRPAEDAIARWLRRLLPAKLAYKLTRGKNVLLSWYLYAISRRKPEKMREFLRNMAREELGDKIDVDKHFNPDYAPWDQRMCLIPDADLFRVLREGSASIETDHIERFTESGILLKSGKSLEADIIVTATGLKLQFLGGAELLKDGEPVHAKDLVVYKGMMLSNLPNLVAVFGYTNASWTLKADLTCRYTCRLLNYMEEQGLRVVVPELDTEKFDTEPVIGLQSGYVHRAEGLLPKQGRAVPWRNRDNYIRDLLAIRFGKVEDEVLKFSR
ncbi:flavin-containing monooxygenase [Biformimicrobium ophioploci]|uniref:NAD(P)/FAD-dependent oxidoreductase n=1 Tax=Biformimicrobium ophioploci TaxID=3036711 RepID=A0ABQ6LUK4_9GAMM|nr:NAD(P)/FAD-dependent oxidoreductase [Microbulbifer sp. NKW57]GMG85754.1 NAD(P)/FAD-dependent oxidoreductase [Microbulbifer sp. NKW57]